MRNALLRVVMTVAPALAGCGSSSTAKDLTAGAADLAAAPADLGCYGAPVTHLEIINACTVARGIDKVPVTPKLNPDGTLPPLP